MLIPFRSPYKVKAIILPPYLQRQWALYTVFTNINGYTTEYQLRKSINDPIALLIKRYDYRSQVQGFEYDVTFNYYVNASSGAIHLGNQDEVEPLPTNWFYLSGDFYTQYFKMIRKTSLS
ncbi:hypothetical protein BH09BAC4_BH09BAC4_27250 [soil metagenome]